MEILRIDKKRTGKRIKKKILDSGRMIKEVAAECDEVTQATLSNWIVGRNMPGLETMLTLCKILDCTVEDLIVLEGEE